LKQARSKLSRSNGNSSFQSSLMITQMGKKRSFIKLCRVWYAIGCAEPSNLDSEPLQSFQNQSSSRPKGLT
ncbi:MAG: hypothetical protein RSE58_14275, partial [Clostridia bacterium]